MALELILALLGLLALCAVVATGRRLWDWHGRRLPLGDFGPAQEVQRILAHVPSAERHAILRRGWLTRQQWQQILSDPLRSLVERTASRRHGLAMRQQLHPEPHGPGHNEAWAIPQRLESQRSTPITRS